MSWGISSTIWSKASLTFWTVWDVTQQHWMDWRIMSQRCSVGFGSGEHGSQLMVGSLSTSRNCLHTLTHEAGHGLAPGGPQHPLHQCRVCQAIQGYLVRVLLLSLYGSLCPSMDMPVETTKPVILNNVTGSITFSWSLQSSGLLLLFLLGKRSRHRSCWWVKDLLQPCPALLE